ncbi:hypothetical protein BLAT2472_11387 [Burkholderia latens]
MRRSRDAPLPRGPVALHRFPGL